MGPRDAARYGLRTRNLTTIQPLWLIDPRWLSGAIRPSCGRSRHRPGTKTLVARAHH